MAAEDEEDDYMSMTFAPSEPTGPTTSLQRTQLQRKQAAERGRPKSKKEQDAAAAAAREKALNTALDSSNKGAKLMAKMGYKGGALGKSENARTRPIEVSIKDDRGGVGADSEKKRKVREQMEAVQGVEKRQKVDESEFRERNRREVEEKRYEGMMWAAMRIAEKFDTEAEEERQPIPGLAEVDPTSDTARTPAKTNVLWRALVNQRADRERERRVRNGLAGGLTALNRHPDLEEDDDDRLALGTEVEDLEEEEDTELDEFTALQSAEKLATIVKYLRETYNYCFYCKYRYPDADMEGCPGTTEDEHD